MQVKKFEAPTLQEALDAIKRELGPEAIILQTKQNRKGFGLMSKGSVEVTAAVSDRSLDKKTKVEKRIPDAYQQKIQTLSAQKQVDVYENYLDKRLERDQVQISNRNKRTAVRYADIQDDESASNAHADNLDHYTNKSLSSMEENIPQFTVPKRIEAAVENFSSIKNESNLALREEIENLKRLVDELRSSVQRDRKKSDFADSDSPFNATDALQEAYEILLHSGVEKRFAIQIMREVSRHLSVEAKADRDQVLDAIADRLLKQTKIAPFFEDSQDQNQTIHVFVGSSGSGKTSSLAKLATHSARNRNERMGVIRVQLSNEEGVDSLNVLAKALHVPYRQVSSREELQVAIQDLSQCNRIFIDTPSVSVRDLNALKQLSEIVSAAPGANVHYVISCVTRDLETYEQSRIYLKLNPNSLMFSRMDEAFSFGSIYSISSRLGIPVTVFLSGKKVTGDWELATAERLAASILNIV
jgi:flagellar biosynthesis protein FlhF